MSVFLWGGTVSGDVSNVANYVGGVGPGAGGNDDVSWQNVTPYGMESGTMPQIIVNFTMTEGAGVSGAGGENDGNLGAAGTNPTFLNVTGLFSIKSKGQYWKIATSGTITKAVVSGVTGQTATAVTGTFTMLSCVGADITVEAAAAVTAYEFQGCKANIKTSATAITTGTAYDGSKVSANSRNHTTANYSGIGTTLCTKGSTAGTGASSGAVVTGNFSAQAAYNKQSAATDTTISLRGRKTKLTPEGNPNASIATATITTVNTTDGVDLIKSAGGYTIVITTETPLTINNGGVPVN